MKGQNNKKISFPEKYLQNTEIFFSKPSFPSMYKWHFWSLSAEQICMGSVWRMILAALWGKPYMFQHWWSVKTPGAGGYVEVQAGDFKCPQKVKCAKNQILVKCKWKGSWEGKVWTSARQRKTSRIAAKEKKKSCNKTEYKNKCVCHEKVRGKVRVGRRQRKLGRSFDRSAVK